MPLILFSIGPFENFELADVDDGSHDCSVESSLRLQMAMAGLDWAGLGGFILDRQEKCSIAWNTSVQIARNIYCAVSSRNRYSGHQNI